MVENWTVLIPSVILTCYKGASMKDVEYLARFRQGSGAIAMNAIDYYKEKGAIVKHEWAMGGETKQKVDCVPTKIDGYKRIDL